MNKLSIEKRATILRLLVEGMSMRSITRTVGCSINTVTKLLENAGAYLGEFQDRALRDLPCTRFEVDEAWAFVYAKNRNLATAKAAPEDAGDVWTWTAICADTKLIPTWRVGDRTTGTAIPFMHDLAERLRHRVQLTTDVKKYRLLLVHVAGRMNRNNCVMRGCVQPSRPSRASTRYGRCSGCPPKLHAPRLGRVRPRLADSARAPFSLSATQPRSQYHRRHRHAPRTGLRAAAACL